MSPGKRVDLTGVASRNELDEELIVVEFPTDAVYVTWIDDGPEEGIRLQYNSHLAGDDPLAIERRDHPASETVTTEARLDQGILVDLLRSAAYGRWFASVLEEGTVRIYRVLEGSLFIAWKGADGKRFNRALKKDEEFTIQPGTTHRTYLFADSLVLVTHRNPTPRSEIKHPMDFDDLETLFANVVDMNAYVAEPHIMLPGYEGKDERGRPHTRVTIYGKPIDVARVEDPGRDGVRVTIVPSGVSIGDVRQTKLDETRYRVDFPDGTSVCQTIHGPKGHWQTAHWHEGAVESYEVQTGCIFLRWVENGMRHNRLLVSGERHVFDPGISHGVYVFRDTKTLVKKARVRLGANSEDKTDDPDLTLECRELTETQMIKLGTPGDI